MPTTIRYGFSEFDIGVILLFGRLNAQHWRELVHRACQAAEATGSAHFAQPARASARPQAGDSASCGKTGQARLRVNRLSSRQNGFGRQTASLRQAVLASLASGARPVDAARGSGSLDSAPDPESDRSWRLGS